MEIKTILVIIVLIVLLYIVIQYITTDTNTLTSSITSGTTMQTISASTLAKSGTTNASNFTYSIWFYINDWNYRYGEPKVIYGRMGSPNGGDIPGIPGSNPCPAVVLGTLQNNLSVALAIYPGEGSEMTSAENVDPATKEVIHTCNVSNIPIQKWVNLLISTYGRTLDIYLDGKLVKTCVLPGIPKINQDADVYVTPMGGFAGWVSRFQYFPNSTDPQTAWNIYKAGYGTSFLSNLFGKYQVKVTLAENGTEQSSFTI